MSYEDAIARIQRLAREKSGELQKETVATAVKLKAEKDAEIEKEARLFNVAQEEAERLKAKRIADERKKLKEEAEREAERLKAERILKEEAERLEKAKMAEMARNKAAKLEITRVDAKKKDKADYFTIISEKIQKDRRIRFTAPKAIKAKLIIGERKKMRIRF